MTQHNESHVLERLLLRAADKSEEELVVIDKTAMGLLRRAKERKLPNNSWYRVVRNGKEVLGYFCGTGVVLSTYLHEDMTPRGEEV